MSKLDIAKEQIAYLKLWLGILVATLITLAGWFLSNFQAASTLLLWLCIPVIFAIAAAGYVLHKRIETKINELEEL